VSQLRRKHES